MRLRAVGLKILPCTISDRSITQVAFVQRDEQPFCRFHKVRFIQLEKKRIWPNSYIILLHKVSKVWSRLIYGSESPVRQNFQWNSECMVYSVKGSKKYLLQIADSSTINGWALENVEDIIDALPWILGNSNSNIVMTLVAQRQPWP